jgi:glycosyltransferase involved in cell wall biosynthesis
LETNAKFDVVLLTKNSLHPCLKETLDSIYREIPVNRLIVADGGSTDGTIELVRGYPGTVVLDCRTGNRATSRQKAIEAVETPWHVHVDSDVILQNNWFNEIKPQLENSDVGAVWGLTIPIEKHYWDVLWTLCVLYRRTPASFQIRQKRYLLHDTVIRTSTLRGIAIPKDLHVFEDEFIGRYLVSKGYKFLKVASPMCYHNLGLRSNKDWMLAGYLARKYGYRKLIGRGSITENLAFSIPRMFWIATLSRDTVAAKMHAQTAILALKGWFMEPKSKTNSSGEPPREGQ